MNITWELVVVTYWRQLFVLVYTKPDAVTCTLLHPILSCSLN